MSTQFTFQAIGTHWQIDIYDDISEENKNILFQKIKKRISDFEKVYSRFLPDSLVGQISREAGQYVFPPDSQKLFDVYRTMYDLTNGLFTPLIGQVLSDAGYDREYSLTQKKLLTTPVAWDKAMVFNYPKLFVKMPAQLDFGSAGKGYVVDIVSELLEENNLHSYCVDAGGDMRHREVHNVPLSVGLEHPDDTSKVVGVVKLLNKSLCGSAGNRRAWGKFHHIINPETLSSPQHIKALWTIANETIVADALTTGLFFVSPETLLKQFDFEYFILNEDFSFEKSEHFPAEIFLRA